MWRNTNDAKILSICCQDFGPSRELGSLRAAVLLGLFLAGHYLGRPFTCVLQGSDVNGDYF